MNNLKKLRALTGRPFSPAFNFLTIASPVAAGETIGIGDATFRVTTGAEVNEGEIPIDLTAFASKASGTLTFSGQPTADQTVTIGSITYTFKSSATDALHVQLGADAEATAVNLLAKLGSHTAVNAAAGVPVAASTTLTSSNTNPTSGDSVTIGGVTYTFVEGAVASDGDVLIGSTADDTLANLIDAINFTGAEGVNYKGTAAHPTVFAGTEITSHAFTITAKTAGANGNAIGTTVTGSTHSFTGSTLSGGQTKIAITAKLAGTAGNSIATTETSTVLAFGGSTLSGGTDANAANSIDAIVDAINGAPINVTAVEYSTGVLIYNSGAPRELATTETLAGADNAWAAATMHGGGVQVRDIPAPVVIKKVPESYEVSANLFRFVLNWEPTTIVVQVQTSAGVIRYWDGDIVINGNVVELNNDGSSDITTGDTIILLAY